MLDGDDDDDHEDEQALENNEDHSDLPSEELSPELILSMTGNITDSNEECYLTQNKFLSKIVDDLFLNKNNDTSKQLTCKKLNSLNLLMNRFLNKNDCVWLESNHKNEEIGACLQKDFMRRNEIIFSDLNKQNDEISKRDIKKSNLLEKCIHLLKNKNLNDLPQSVIKSFK